MPAETLRCAVLACALFTAGSCTTTSLPPPDTPAGPPPILNLPPASAPPAFNTLPDWNSAPKLPSVEAFRRSCGAFSRRPANRLLSRSAAWAGTTSDWQPACAAIEVASDETSAQTIIEALFTPVEVFSPSGKTRFTGYFEPTYEARRTPVPPYTEPVPALPADLIPNGAKPQQRLADGTVRPYPSRAEITRAGVIPIAYAHPADVFFMQIQGSGRLNFPDGLSVRAAYAAHNGHPFRSTANWLMNTGKISRGEASMQGIRAWMDRAPPSEVRAAMNANPRFVFFRELPLGDVSLGPTGAQNLPLTPLGSMAVDTDIYPLGLPMYVQTNSPGLGGDWAGLLVAQDTGGAIKGAVRGDIYFGTGPEAGSRAGTQNAPGRLWVLLPRVVAQRLAETEAGRPKPVPQTP